MVEKVPCVLVSLMLVLCYMRIIQDKHVPQLVLQKYGFNKQFCDIIMSICKNTTCNVILPYGLSDDIKITRGVRQGCPLSPTLFILFLDPLMLQLEESNKGYKLQNKNKIPGGAYADDMVLHTNKNEDLQELMNLCVNYFKFVGLQIAVDGRDKTVYTHNLNRDIYDLYIRDKEGNRVKIPIYSKTESYKYLGLWINLELNWEKQQHMSEKTINRYISFLYQKCFNASQTIEILNLVVFPAITYRMNFLLADMQSGDRIQTIDIVNVCL